MPPTPSAQSITPATRTPAATEQTAHKRRAAREVVDILHAMSSLLDARLSRQQLSYCVSLIENGVDPGALADVLKELRARYPDPDLDQDEAAHEDVNVDGEEEQHAR